MTLDELAKETLVQKHLRLMQAKCPHAEMYSTSCTSKDGHFTSSFCLDCGLAWHGASAHSPAEDVGGSGER